MSTAEPVESGVLTCQDCTKHRERAFTWESKFWRLSNMVVAAIGERAHLNLPGTGVSWAQAYAKITGQSYAEAEKKLAEKRRNSRTQA